MLMEKQRLLIIEYGKKMVANCLVKGTGGNISVYDSETGLMAITPGGMDYFALTAEDIVVMKLDGERVESPRKPSSEWRMHAGVYAARPDIRAVVHTHSPAAAAMAALRVPLPPVNYLVALASEGEVPCARYAVFGSEQLARNAVEAMGRGNACFLAAHGLLTGAETLKKAFSIAEELDFCCDVYLRASSAGSPKPLTPDQMEEIREKLKTYGQ